MFLSLEIDQKKNSVTFSFTIGSNTVQVGIFGPKSVEQQVRIADSGLQGVRSVQTVLDVLSSSGPCRVLGGPALSRDPSNPKRAARSKALTT